MLKDCIKETVIKKIKRKKIKKQNIKKNCRKIKTQVTKVITEDIVVKHTRSKYFKNIRNDIKYKSDTCQNNKNK